MYFHIPPGIDPGLGLDARPGTVDIHVLPPILTTEWSEADVVENKERVPRSPRSRAPGDAMRVRNMIDLLRTRANAQPEDTAYTFLESGEQAGDTLTWAALDRRSRALGASIAVRVEPGARVLIMLPPGIDFAPALFGVLYAGAIALPTYPPAGARADRTSARVRGMIADAGVSLVLSHSGLHAQVATLEAMIPELTGVPWLDIDQVDDNAAEEWRDPMPVSSAIALLQYTSGSTATPRGVMVSHGNLLHNLALSARLAAYGSRQRGGVVAAGQPRHGADQRRAAGRAQWIPDGPDGAWGVPAATGTLAPGHFALRRHA